MYPLKAHHKIVGIYLIVALLWIWFSDQITAQWADSAREFLVFQNIKGWFFVLVTASLLYLLIRQSVNKYENAQREMVEAYDQTISGWVTVMDARHRETRHHTQRVTAMALSLAVELGIEDEQTLKTIERGAILHDIGKMAIPDAVLTKPGKFTDAERAIMQKHPVIARDLLQNIAFLKPCMDIPHYHHERWDGQGYPEGLSGRQIPFLARLFSVVDVWDAISSDRVYKSAWSETEVLAYLEAEAGSQFDPFIATTFVQNYQKLKTRAARYEQHGLNEPVADVPAWITRAAG